MAAEADYHLYMPDLTMRQRLEMYLVRQLFRNYFDLNANLTLLRIYRYYPKHRNLKYVIYVLVKGLMAMPDRHFSVYLCVISKSMQNEEQVKDLIDLHRCLETARFTDFWSQFETYDNRYKLTLRATGFREAIREYAVHVISLTYEKVPVPVLSMAVNLQGPELQGFIEKYKHKSRWVVENNANGDEIIILPPNGFNYPKFKNDQGGST